MPFSRGLGQNCFFSVWSSFKTTKKEGYPQKTTHPYGSSHRRRGNVELPGWKSRVQIDGSSSIHDMETHVSLEGEPGTLPEKPTRRSSVCKSQLVACGQGLLRGPSNWPHPRLFFEGTNPTSHLHGLVEAPADKSRLSSREKPTRYSGVPRIPDKVATPVLAVSQVISFHRFNVLTRLAVRLVDFCLIWLLHLRPQAAPAKKTCQLAAIKGLADAGVGPATRSLLPPANLELTLGQNEHCSLRKTYTDSLFPG